MNWFDFRNRWYWSIAITAFVFTYMILDFFFDVTNFWFGLLWLIIAIPTIVIGSGKLADIVNKKHEE